MISTTHCLFWWLWLSHDDPIRTILCKTNDWFNRFIRLHCHHYCVYYFDQIMVRLCWSDNYQIMILLSCHHHAVSITLLQTAWHMNYYELTLLMMNKTWHIMITWWSYKIHQITRWYHNNHRLDWWSHKNHQIMRWSHKNHLCYIIVRHIIIIMFMRINIDQKLCKQIQLPTKGDNNSMHAMWRIHWWIT